MTQEDSADFAGVPDSFQRLWTPHRMVYIDGEGKPRDDKECPFCASPARTDEDGLIVHRGEHAYVVMNLFPYNPGHLLVCPYRHYARYVDSSADETREISELTQQAIRVLERVSRPSGYNVGINQGAVAGAGIAMHLHQHVVPRWQGDVNFLPIVGQTKAVPQLLSDARDRLAAAWGDVRP